MPHVASIGTCLPCRGTAPPRLVGDDKGTIEPINYEGSGGLKSKGHPPRATGVAQCVELFEPLRGTAVTIVEGGGGGL